MRSSKLRLAGIAIVAALVGVLACDGAPSPSRPSAGGSGSNQAGTGGKTSMAGYAGTQPSGGSIAAGGAGGADGGAPENEAGAAGESVACGELAAPNAWASWPMPNPASSGLPNAATYTVNRGQVTDEVTGLVWQRDVDARNFTWERAKNYCSCLTLDGVGGWRLPSRIELVSLVDWTKTSPSIDENAFPATTSENFWTSSPVITDPGLGYLVFFLNGHTTYSDLTYGYRVRCVKSPESTAPERYTIANGTVLDKQTKLTWEQNISTSLYGWSEAKAYCDALPLDGGGWRTPAINEIQTLVDDTKNPAIDLPTFPKTPSEYFWSSSPVIDDASRAWTTFFTNGSTYSFAISAKKNVRCVR